MARRHKALNVYGGDVDTVEAAIEQADGETVSEALAEICEDYLAGRYYGGPRYTGDYDVE